MTDEERNEQNEENEERQDEERDDEEREETSASSGDDSGDDDSGDDDDSERSGDDDDSEKESGGTTVGDVMSENPVSVEPGDSIEDAAAKMKEADTGAVLVVDGDELKGIVTDRDIAVDATAEGNTDAKVEDVASTDTTTIKADADLREAIDLMREKKVRRLPVVDDDGEPVGIVSLGDLAIEADDDSALKEISAAEPNA
jgi:CBS domain-containing protein